MRIISKSIDFSAQDELLQDIAPLNDFLLLDIETTGLNPKSEKIIELGAARIREGKVVDTFSAFVNPGRSLSERIVELTGISDRDVENAPYIEEIIQDFVDFTGDDVLLGHNLSFDYSFVKKAAVNNKLSFEKDGIDTLRIARRFLAQLESRRLGFLCEHYQIELEAHRALNDALATHRLYQKLCAEFINSKTVLANEKEKNIFEPGKMIYSVKKESPITQKQFEHILRLADRYRLGLTQEKDTLTESVRVFLEPVEGVNSERIDVAHISKNEASRIIDKILSLFAARIS